MRVNELYQKQKKIAFMQFLFDLPNFIIMLVSAIISGSMIVWIDVLDSFGYVIRSIMVLFMSHKLMKDLRYEYNYGIGKVEAVSALLCDGVIFSGLIMMIAISVHDIFQPNRPSDLVIAVVLLKIINVTTDVIFIKGQKKIVKGSSSAIAESTYASYYGALMFDSVALISLVVIWLFRDYAISWYFTPVVSIILAGYLICKCIARIKDALNELTDKTLPEEIQMELLKIMTQCYDQYSQLHFIKSHKSGMERVVDLVISFEEETTYAQILELRSKIQEKVDQVIPDCTINFIVQ